MLALRTIERILSQDSSQDVTLISVRLQSLLAFSGKAANPLIPRLADRRDQAVKARIPQPAGLPALSFTWSTKDLSSAKRTEELETGLVQIPLALARLLIVSWEFMVTCTQHTPPMSIWAFKT